MATDTWLRALAIGLPLAGALVFWQWGSRFPAAQRWVAAAIFGVAGVIVLALFLIDRHYACVLASGSRSCLWDGAASLGLFLLDALFAVRCIVSPGEGKRRDFILMLLLSGALAGIGLSLNLLLLIVFLNVFLFVGHRWLTKKGFQPRFLVLRDDYRDGDDR
jgi:NADH:ubiquinone oxidoreductase subunit 4 (subunit M)